MLSLLVIDSGNIFLEGQTVAALFAEMARAQRACERMCARAEVEFAAWKAHMVRAFKAQMEASGKKSTDKDAEANYRAHADYKQHAHLATHYKFLGFLFSDIKEAFSIKAKMIAAQSRMMEGHEHATSAELATDDDQGESTERLEELAAMVIGQSYSVSPEGEEPSEEDGEDGEEYEEEDGDVAEEEEGDEDEDDDLPPPPPPPKRKSAKKTTAKRTPRKRSK